MPGLDDANRLGGQRLGRVPVAPLDRHDDPLGQGHRRGWQSSQVRRHLDCVCQDGIGRGEFAVQHVGGAFEGQNRPAKGATRSQESQGGNGVGAHLAHSVAAQQGPEIGEPAVERTAVRERPFELTTLGRVSPVLGRCRVPQQGLHLRTEDGDLGVLLDQPALREPVEPAAGGVDPAFGVGPLRQTGDEPGDPIGIVCGLGMIDRRLRHAMTLEPVRRPNVQLGNQRRLRSPELGGEQLAEEVVVAIPLPTRVERDEQEVRRLQRLEDLGRSRGTEHRVAHRRGKAIEERGSSEERHHGRRKSREELRLQIVRHESVVTRERHGFGALASGADREHGEVQAHRPALGPPDELGELGAVERDAGALEQGGRLLLVHGQVTDSDLDHVAPRAQEGGLQRRRVTRGDRQLRSLGDAHGQLGDGIAALRVVEHLRRGRTPAGRVRSSTRGWMRSGRWRWPRWRPGRGERSEHAAVDGLDLVEGEGGVGQEDGGVVVTLDRPTPRRDDSGGGFSPTG